MDESMMKNGDGESCACVPIGNMRTRFYIFIVY
jgi:hypothetical protein